MAFDVTENTIAIWFLQLTDISDFIAHLKKTDEGLVLQYRFRYYDEEDPGNDAFSGKDRKTWYTAKWKGVEAKELVIETVRTMLGRMEEASGYKSDELLMQNGDLDAFFEEFKKRPYAHLKYAH